MVKYLVKYECCGRKWYGKYQTTFIPMGICPTCDDIPVRTIYDIRQLKLERILE